MKQKNLFFIIFLLTIILIRIFVIIFPERDTYIFGILIHHFWYGIILLLIVFTIPKKYSIPKIFLSAIGLGYITDQLIFILLGAGKDKEYWALPSLLGTIILIVIIFPLRKKIIDSLKLS